MSNPSFKANAARAHSPFLLDPQVGQYLESLHKEAFRIMPSHTPGDRHGPQAERMEKAARIGSDKLAMANRIPELVQKFECLRLTDLSK